MLGYDNKTFEERITMHLGHPMAVEKMKTDLEKVERDELWGDTHVSEATSRILQIVLQSLDALAGQMRDDLDSLA